MSAPTLPFLQVLIPYNGRQWLSVYPTTINDVLINMGGVHISPVVAATRVMLYSFPRGPLGRLIP